MPIYGSSQAQIGSIPLQCAWASSHKGRYPFCNRRGARLLIVQHQSYLRTALDLQSAGTFPTEDSELKTEISQLERCLEMLEVAETVVR